MAKARSTDRIDIHTMERETPYPERLKGKVYEQELLELQIELVKPQSWVRESGERVALVFEGRDAAGKGGAIKRFTEHLNPRFARVVALTKPNETEQGRSANRRIEIVLHPKDLSKITGQLGSTGPDGK